MKINNIDYTIYKQYGTNENSKIKKHSKSLEEVIKHFVDVDNKHDATPIGYEILPDQ